MDFGLPSTVIELMLGVFAQFPEILEVKIYGSRAKGTYKQGSDIDLSYFSDRSKDISGRLLGELDDLPTPYSFDVNNYEAITHQPLVEHIDRVGKRIYKKGFKETAVGWIPDEWVHSVIGEVAVVNMGQSPKSENYNDRGDGLPLIQGNADIKNRVSTPRIWTSQITKRCESGDLLMTVRAPVGAVAKANQTACLGRGICAIQPRTAEKEFVYQFLLSYEPKWNTLEQGSTFTAVNGKDVQSLGLPLPPPSQNKKRSPTSSPR